MKVLFIYPNSLGYGRVPLGLSILISVLSEAGHEVELFDTTYIYTTDNFDTKMREDKGTVLATDTTHLYTSHTLDEIDQMLKSKIRSFAPDLVGVSILEDNYSLSDHFFGLIKSIDKNIPIIVGGPTPTIAPGVVMEHPDIDYLIQGEAEVALLEFCNLMQMGKSVKGVGNLWYKENGDLRHNPMGPITNLDTLPMQDLSYWNKGHFIKAYDGKLQRVASIELSRGCPRACAYCIEEAYRKLFSGLGQFYRHKAISTVAKEINFLKENFDVEMIFFNDDNFLMQMSEERLEEFSDIWMREINLPYWMSTEPLSIIHKHGEKRLKMLRDTGCVGVGMGVEAGSEWLRENILWRDDSVEDVRKTFKALRGSGIRTTANVMVGFPAEDERDILDSINLIKEIEPDSIGLNFVAPYIGTPIHEIAKRKGYIKILDKPGYRDMAVELTGMQHGSVYKDPTMAMPQLSKSRQSELGQHFLDYVNETRPFPSEYLPPDTPERDKMRQDLATEMRENNPASRVKNEKPSGGKKKKDFKPEEVAVVV